MKENNWQEKLAKSGYLPLLMAAVAFVYHSIGLSRVEIGYDEPFSIFVALHDLAGLREVLSHHNNPPLYELILHFWIKLGGGRIDAGWVRMPSLIFSAFSAGVIFFVGQKHWSWKVGMVAGFLFVFSTREIAFAHEARAYALATLLTALSMAFWLELIQNPGKRMLWIGLGVVNLLLIYAHYFGGFLLVAQGMYFLIRFWKDRKSQGLNFLLWALIPILGYLPQLSTMIARYGIASQSHHLPLSDIQGLYYFWTHYFNQPVTSVISISIFVASVAFFWKNYSARSPAGLALLVVFPGIYLVVFLLGFAVPIFYEKYLFVVCPALFLWLGMMIWSTRWNKVGWVLAGALVVGQMATSKINPEKEEGWKDMAQLVQNHQDGAVTLISPEWLARHYTYYVAPDLLRKGAQLEESLAAGLIFPLEQGQKSIPYPWDEVEELWLLHSFKAMQEWSPLMNEKIERDFGVPERSWTFRGFRLEQYQRR